LENAANSTARVNVTKIDFFIRFEIKNLINVFQRQSYHSFQEIYN